MIAARRQENSDIHQYESEQQLSTLSEFPIAQNPVLSPINEIQSLKSSVLDPPDRSHGPRRTRAHSLNSDRANPRNISLSAPNETSTRMRMTGLVVNHDESKAGQLAASQSGKEKNTQHSRLVLPEISHKPVQRLSKEQVIELTAGPLSPSILSALSPSVFAAPAAVVKSPAANLDVDPTQRYESSDDAGGERKQHDSGEKSQSRKRQPLRELQSPQATAGMSRIATIQSSRPLPSRTVSTPPLGGRKKSISRHDRPGPIKARKVSPVPADIPNGRRATTINAAKPVPRTPEPDLASLPMPPLSIPTYLQLELDAARQPSGLGDMPFESSSVKFERLQDFLLLPAPLEHLLWFGTFACMDAWLSVFTILPLRFVKALYILSRWWVRNALKEVLDMVEFVYAGSGRLWRRSREARHDSAPSSRANSRPRDNSIPFGSSKQAAESPGVIRAWPEIPKRQPYRRRYQHRRTRSTPSLLLPSHKADLLKGLLVVLSSIILLQLDPSRMYHNIRGQAAIKLYVIYNGLEVGDRLLSAVGQDVLECLFSREVLERDLDGRSRIIRPAWMFLVALMYNVTHAAALLYQVITLNVAVNSYSNALLTLLLSNQFVEIKAAVFKKVEKDNLFQLTCADVVERFQLWLMLLIIAMRNMVEVGGISISISNSFDSSSSGQNNASFTESLSFTSRIWPTTMSILPKLTGKILGPFFIVLGSEMVVDWIKHAYIGKFNDTKPMLYRRYLDILAKDYYTHAFGDQNLMKRIGLPVLPLACLFVRASIQTYHMFLATHMPLPLPSPATSLSVESATVSSTPATQAALGHVDQLMRRALGRSSFPIDEGAQSSAASYIFDDAIAFSLLLLFVLIVFLLLLAVKLVLGIVMLRWAQSRYAGMKERERSQVDVGGTRLGVSAMVEVDDDKRRYIFEDDPKGYQRFKDKEEKIRKSKEGERGRGVDLSRVTRYDMVAKRIW